MIWLGSATARSCGKKIRDDDYGKSFRIILPVFSVIRRVVLPKVLCQDSVMHSFHAVLHFSGNPSVTQ